MNKNLISRNGFIKAEEELENIVKKQKPKIIAAIAEAREHGDLKENAEYHAAKEQQALLEGRIIELENIVKNTEIVDIKNINSDKVHFGATVELFEEIEEKNYTYQILSSYEADPEKKIIGIHSLLAKSLLSNKAGDIVEFSTPTKTKVFKIISVKYL